jgi:cobalt/nickel transport system ATP-binding protein
MTENIWDIEVKDLTYFYPDGTSGLSRVNLSVAPGESVAILGPNGAGKSTLLLMLAGLIIGEGDITIRGIRLTEKSIREIRKRVGIVFQNPDDQLFCPTIYDDAAFGPRNMGLNDTEIHRRVHEALDAMGLLGYEDRSSQHLSIGEKKRASIATILTMDPEIIAFDEPSANLDPEGIHELKKVITSIDKTKLIVTHDIALAARLATRGVVMRNGTIIEDLPMKRLAGDKELLKKLKLLFD